MPYLSICIPTYNQPAAVEGLLHSIHEQWTDSLEVLVCDDSSNDETSNIVNKFSQIYPIKYVKRDRAGLDNAVLDLVCMASGEYIWWIGDDQILPGAVETIIRSLNRNSPDFLWVNSCDALNKNLLTFNVKNDVLTRDPNFVLSFDLGLLGFITATIFKRQVALKYLNSARSYVGSAWSCLYLILCVVTSGGSLSLLQRPCFSSMPKPSGEIRWYDQFQVFGINLLHVVLKFESHFDGGELKKALNRNLVRVLKSILVERALGHKTGFASSNVRIKTIFYNYYSFPAFWLYLPFMLLPSKLLMMLYPCYKKIIRGA